MAEYTEDCCFNYRRDHCKGPGCPCACHSAEPTYTTDIDLQAGAVHVTLTDAEMVAWVQSNVHGPLVADLLGMIDQHGAQQVVIAVGIASCVDLWRQRHPERWVAAITKARGG